MIGHRWKPSILNALRLVLGKCCYKFNAVCYMEVKFLFKKDVKIGLGPGLELGTYEFTVPTPWVAKTRAMSLPCP